jgi:SAM-dependent methyltransferase
MQDIFNKYLEKLYRSAVELNIKNIFSLHEKNREAIFVDLGCDDGVITNKIADIIGTKDVFGVEIVEESIREAVSRGVQVKNFDLNGKFDFEDNSVDVIHANQVIEHLHNSDNFLSEIYRILKNGGYAIISSENGSSWCNIFASIMGWQIFSLTIFSGKKQCIGNPFSLHKNGGGYINSWSHVRIYNIRGLKEYLEAFDFIIEEVRGAGYFPLPGILGDIDKVHSHFITFKIRKK